MKTRFAKVRLTFHKEGSCNNSLEWIGLVVDLLVEKKLRYKRSRVWNLCSGLKHIVICNTALMRWCRSQWRAYLALLKAAMRMSVHMYTFIEENLGRSRGPLSHHPTKNYEY